MMVACPGRWVSQLCPVLWPARLPDLNPLDFFIGDTLQVLFIKDQSTIMDLRSRIHYAVVKINLSGSERRLKRSFMRSVEREFVKNLKIE